MADLLLEILSEEIPARMQRPALEELERRVLEGLKAAGLPPEGTEAWVTPRRLALSVTGLAESQPDTREERRGPRADAPEKAIQGFLRGNGLTLDQCETRESDKGTFLFALIERKGRPTAEVLADLLPEVLAAVPWPKSMRWGAGEARWVRPLHSVLCLFAGRVIAFEVAGVRTSASTRGHRFHAPDVFEVTDLASYRAGLAAARVMLDGADRRARIAAEAERLAAAEGLRLVPDQGLLDELAGLVEWPVVLMGRMDERFLKLPREVLVSAMRAHQRYLAVEDADGGLAARFIVVANLEATDGGGAIVAGNERVLTARLADAEFFWETDLKRSLAERVAGLDRVVFHARLGSLGEKVARIERLAADIAGPLGAEAGESARAARLAKADLVSEMVGEFPDLQGLMGRYYARAQGEAETVADAIGQHYSPLGPNDACPTAPTALAVSLADKIDTLVGFFAIGETPTGSRDPFGLRRAGLGVIRMVLENQLRLPLASVFRRASEAYGGEIADGGENVEESLLAFLADRLKVHLRGDGVRHDLIQAVFALGREDDLHRLIGRVAALARFVESEDGANLLTAYRRAVNIVRIEEGKDDRVHDGPVDQARLVEPAEVALAGALEAAAAASETALAVEDFEAAMAALAGLRAPVDAFFDDVTVNADDSSLRENRLRLLSRIRQTLHRVADFSAVEG